MDESVGQGAKRLVRGNTPGSKVDWASRLARPARRIAAGTQLRVLRQPAGRVDLKAQETARGCGESDVRLLGRKGIGSPVDQAVDHARPA